MRAIGAALAALLLISTASAQQVPRSSRAAAEMVIQAHREGDDATLQAVASAPKLDPWFVADELCVRGAMEAARAFAAKVKGDEAPHLAAYLASWKEQPEDAAVRAAVEQARKASAARDWEGVLEVLEGAEPSGKDVLSVRMLWGRALVAGNLRRFEAAARDYAKAGEIAARLGWLSRAVSCFVRGGRVAETGGDHRTRLALFLRLVEVEERKTSGSRLGRALAYVGAAHRKLGDHAKALAAFRRSLEVIEASGDGPATGVALGDLGDCYWNLSLFERARACYERALPLVEGDKATARTLHQLGRCLCELGDRVEALALLRRAVEIRERIRDPRLEESLCAAAMAERIRGGTDEAMLLYERALSVSEAQRRGAGVARACLGLSALHLIRGSREKGLALRRRGIGILERLGDGLALASAWGNIAGDEQLGGRHAEALACYEKALALMRKTGSLHGEGRILENLGTLWKDLSDPGRAAECFREARGKFAELGEETRVDRLESVLGVTAAEMGRRRAGLVRCREALERMVERGDLQGEAEARAGIGQILTMSGRYAEAIGELEAALVRCRGLGQRWSESTILDTLGMIHRLIGEPERAVACVEEAHGIKADLGDSRDTVITLGHLATCRRDAGRREESEATRARALAAARKLGAGYLVMVNLREMADDAFEASRWEEARTTLEEVLRLSEAIGGPVAIAEARFRLGRVRDREGDAGGLPLMREAVAAVEEVPIWMLVELSRRELVAGKPKAVVELARQGIARVAEQAGGLPEEHGAAFRARSALFYEVGLSAALQLGDEAAAFRFAESGRAAGLLESLEAGDALREAVLPPDLLEAEIESRAAETTARKALAAAVRLGRLSEVRARRVALEEAQEAGRRVAQRIQRTAKAAADVVCPVPAAASRVRAALAGDEALLVYARGAVSSTAFVLTRSAARTVPLAENAEIDEAVAAFDPQSGDPGDAVAALRALLLSPLEIGKDVKRLIVSPSGSLTYVPFSLLAPGREVVFAPSATTWLHLGEEGRKRGRGVLALGDPDYRAEPDSGVVARLRSGLKLVPLGYTKAEARSVGTKVLLGEDATETRLRQELAKRDRWRALHLACHGLIDPERPMFSSLALAQGAGDDGFLTVLDVYRLPVSADLVTLSACDTGKGTLVRGEGLMGLARAFMFAGAPRVLVSLWKVDDEATRALMVRFYELWNPKGGKAGLPAATALRLAQDHIRSRKGWEHPRYWAAWVLWGLGG